MSTARRTLRAKDLIRVELRDHPEIRRLKREYSSPLRRTCGLSGCGEQMSVDLIGSESDWKAPGYCSALHQDIANRRRKKLRATLARIESLMASPEALAQVNEEAQKNTEPTKTLTKAELERIARRLRWELEGVAPARASGPSSRTA